jgi:hypothetical protein
MFIVYFNHFSFEEAAVMKNDLMRYRPSGITRYTYVANNAPLTKDGMAMSTTSPSPSCHDDGLGT